MKRLSKKEIAVRRQAARILREIVLSARKLEALSERIFDPALYFKAIRIWLEAQRGLWQVCGKEPDGDILVAIAETAAELAGLGPEIFLDEEDEELEDPADFWKRPPRLEQRE